MTHKGTIVSPTFAVCDTPHRDRRGLQERKWRAWLKRSFAMIEGGSANGVTT